MFENKINIFFSFLGKLWGWKMRKKKAGIKWMAVNKMGVEKENCNKP